jgi:hypothetical protein
MRNVGMLALVGIASGGFALAHVGTAAPVQPTPGAPRPGVPQPAVIAASPAGLPAPHPLHYTTDVGECKRAGGDDGTCGALVTQNAVAFYFTWNCAGPDCAIAGFKLKDANRPPPMRVATLNRLGGGTSDAIDTSAKPLFIERPPSGGWTGRCYEVTAFRTPVAKLVPDGSGGMKPAGGTTGAYEESPPGAKACVEAVTRSVALPAARMLNFTRTYDYVLPQGKKQAMDDTPTAWGGVNIGKLNLSQPGYSIVSQFNRAGISFDAAPLGDVTVHGGRFAYDTSKDCRPRLFSPAPAGWESASWPKAPGPAIAGSWAGGGSPSLDVSAAVRGWRAPKKMTFLLQESLTEGLDAEAFNYDIGMMDPCSSSGTNVRLLLDIGVTK